MLKNPFITCLLCHGKSEARLCQHCTALLPRIKHGCIRCALPLNHEGLICGQCQKHPPHFDHVVAPFLYQGIIAKLCLALKFHNNLCAGQVLAELICQHYTPDPSTLLLPIPLHRRRLQQRGYNQAAIIASYIAKHFNMTIDYSLVSRIRHTKAQMALPKKARQRNVASAFQLMKPNFYQKITLIDDIITTGSTAGALSNLLKQHGAKEIVIVCAARTDLNTAK